MRKIVVAVLLGLLPLVAFAQNTPVGKWRTIDDKTGKPKSVVEIYETTNGTLAAKVLEVLQSDKGPHPLCDACKGERHNKPVEGMPSRKAICCAPVSRPPVALPAAFASVAK